MAPHLRFGSRPCFALAAVLGLSHSANAADVVVTLPAGDGFVIEDNTSTIERLRVDEATGNISRNGTLFVHTSGGLPGNTFVGEGAGDSFVVIDTFYGYGNSAFGKDALFNADGAHDNSAFGHNALRKNTTGSNNSAFGVGALRFNTTADFNSAFGESALYSNTTGSFNSALGGFALDSNTTGSSNSAFGGNALSSNTTADANSAFGRSALGNNTTGMDNSAFGRSALGSNTTADANSAFGRSALGNNTTGIDNSSFGTSALRYNTTGNQNNAFGTRALRYNTTGNSNNAFGRVALEFNTTGVSNSAFGASALGSNTTGKFNSAFGAASLIGTTTGENNSAFGVLALFTNTTGHRNVALGYGAGRYQTTGSDNIYIKNTGVAGESGQIKIGNTTNHTQTTIAGIHGNTSTSGIAVLVNASGTLGTTTSSARFKQDVRDMGDASELLMGLRPVTFRYRASVAAGEDVQEYGLIAEEVAEVAPELVAIDAESQPYSVRYHVLPSLLLNEAQKQQRTIDGQASVIKEQRARLGLEAERIDVQEAQIATLIARLDALESVRARENTETVR